MRSTRMLRSWPWSIALATVLAGFVLLGLLAVTVRTSLVEQLVALGISALAAFALARALTTGVRVMPSGMIIRELTRSTPVLWTQVRAVTCEKSQGRGYVPVLALNQTAGPGRRGRGTTERLEVTVLAAYREPAARHRADQLAAALAASRSTKR